jgi:protein phosphatase
LSISFKIEAAGETDIGRVRATNQDSFLLENSCQLYGVADGMGGHAGGEIASLVCVEKIVEYLKEKYSDSKKEVHPSRMIMSTMGRAINVSSSKIFERALEEPALMGMGTTATIMQVFEDYAYFAHVGDSRLYLLRCGLLFQLTNDHSLVAEQVRAGLIPEEEAETHHLRNVITRSVGYQEEEDVDTYYCKIEKGDTFLLCSDGLHGKLKDQAIAKILPKPLGECSKELILQANNNGGQDNITVVLVRIL